MTATTIKSTGGGAGVASASGRARKVLSFCLGAEEYGMDILAVREIIGLIHITPLPRTPVYVKGVINLRGKIIPVMELRTRFGLQTVDYTEETCIIVVDIPADAEHEARQMGVIVDSVREVLDIPVESIEPAPQFSCQVSMDYISGIGKAKDKVVVMLDTARVMSSTEKSEISAALGDGASAGSSAVR